MREETRKRLDHARWRELAGWLPAIAVLAVLVAGFFAFHMSEGEVRHVAGTVQSANWRLNEDTGQHYPFIEVKLDSGMSVRVGTLAPALPVVGDRITVRERALLFDYMTTYEWEGPLAARHDPAPVPPPPTPVSHP